MAKENVSKLQIYINPSTAQSALSTQGIQSYGTQAGYIAFDEKTHLLYVNGQAYGLSESQASSLSKLTLEYGTTIEGIVELPENQQQTLQNILTELNSRTIANAQAAQAVREAAQAAQETADSKIASVEGETGDNALIDVSTSAQAVSISATQKLQNAVAAAESAIQSVITNGITYSVQDTTAQGTITGTNITVGSIQGAQGTHNYSNNSIAYAIDQLDYAINTLSGDSGLTGVLEEIRAIKKELETEGTGENTLSTIIDALRKLKVNTTPFVGINADGTAGVGGEEVALQTSLGNLVTYAGNQAQAAQSNAQTYANTQAQAAQSAAQTYANNQAQAAQSAAKTYADGLIDGLDAQATYNQNGLTLTVVEENGLITSVQGAIADNIYDTYGSASTAQSNAQTYANAQATYYAQDAKQYAKEYADSVATSAASQVISWEVLGS